VGPTYGSTSKIPEIRGTLGGGDQLKKKYASPLKQEILSSSSKISKIKKSERFACRDKTAVPISDATDRVSFLAKVNTVNDDTHISSTAFVFWPESLLLA